MVHEHGKRFECTQCDRKYKSVTALRTHVKDKHSDVIKKGNKTERK